jgi:Acyl-CoA dehydrogenase, C-terminal domain
MPAGMPPTPTAPLLSSASWRSLYDVARHDGPAAALTRAYAGQERAVIIAGPAGHALAPSRAVSTALEVWPSGAAVRSKTLNVSEPVPLHRSGLVTVHGLATASRTANGTADGTPGPYRTVAYRGWLLALVWLRLGVCAGLLEAALSHLSARLVAGAPLLRQQLIQGELADAVTEHLAAQALVSGHSAACLSDDTVAQAHQHITSGDRVLLPLLGAGGITTDGPGRAAYVSELLADVYLSRSAGEAAGA